MQMHSLIKYQIYIYGTWHNIQQHSILIKYLTHIELIKHQKESNNWILQGRGFKSQSRLQHMEFKNQRALSIFFSFLLRKKTIFYMQSIKEMKSNFKRCSVQFYLYNPYNYFYLILFLVYFISTFDLIIVWFKVLNADCDSLIIYLFNSCQC